jgi:hypothetical protein
MNGSAEIRNIRSGATRRAVSLNEVANDGRVIEVGIALILTIVFEE